MARRPIKEIIEDMAEGARLIDEMRKDGRLPPDYNMENFDAMREEFISRAREGSRRPTFREVLEYSSSVQSSNMEGGKVGKDPSGLGWQARSSMYNAGSDKKFKPLKTSNSSLHMDLMDQAGWDYGTSDMFPEI